MSEAKTRQKSAKRRSLYLINEYFEPIFNAVFASAVVLRQPLKVGMLAFALLISKTAHI